MANDLDGRKMESKVYVGHKVHGCFQVALFTLILMLMALAIAFVVSGIIGWVNGVAR
jgi:hypothetical protein